MLLLVFAVKGREGKGRGSQLYPLIYQKKKTKKQKGGLYKGIKKKILYVRIKEGRETKAGGSSTRCIMNALLKKRSHFIALF